MYGCEFAKGDKGQAAVQYLQNALGVCQLQLLTILLEKTAISP
ncbi:MAG: hypothetical protein H6554_06180 [Chitinophagales bacterium]|nr:hypothetical protein [Chitinophagales bacterium]